MPQPDQLPALIRLFDDPSLTVRRAVITELKAWGDALAEALDELDEPLDPSLRAEVLAVAAGPLPEPEPEPVPAPEPEPLVPTFAVGQLVRHKRYGYRGVIVAVDQSCEASADWYQKNSSQPDRKQPWYHVLVHESESVTYAAESSLSLDTSGDGVRHPWVPVFFNGFESGRYLRNDRPWPPTAD